MTNFKPAITELFYEVKDKLMLYKKETCWRYKIELIFSVCPQHDGNSVYIDSHYSIVAHIWNLMCLYKSINDIEADYLSMMYTRKTWDENMKLFNG